MELEFKEADLHKLEDGDLIVIQSMEMLKQDTYIKVSESLNFLKDKIEKETGKHINFLLCDSNIAVKHFRPVE